MHTRTWPFLGRHSGSLAGGVFVALGLALLVALRAGWLELLPGSAEAAAEAGAAAPAPVQTVIELAPEKLAAADLHIGQVKTRSIQSTRTVPATIAYDAAKRLPVNAPVACVVVKVLVEPGQTVAVHQPLAELSSREVGEARDEVLQRDAELALARREEARADLVARNVTDLLGMLAARPKLSEVEAALDQRTLGEYRESIVAAYSKLLLAELVLGESAQLESGTLSRRLVEERKTGREIAAAQFTEACDTAKFSALQARERSRAAAEQAERLSAVAKQALANLLGPLADMTPVSERARLSELVLKTPLAGRIEERKAVAAARIAAGDPLFTIADTSIVWVMADIRERDWAALEVVAKSVVTVRVPALGNTEFQANVHHLGGQIGADTRSLPLVAELANSDGRLRPGMFAWVDVPLEAPRQALVVPTSAIMRHENQAFVLVPSGDRKFERVDVRLGWEAGDHVEVVSGLSEGDQVVDQGAFYLKSELLLEREE